MDSHDYAPIASELHEWFGIEDDNSFGAELADCEAELSEFGQHAVQGYWDQVIAEELGTAALPSTPLAWSELGTRERIRLRRYERRAAGTELRLITAEVDASASNSGEAA